MFTTTRLLACAVLPLCLQLALGQNPAPRAQKPAFTMSIKLKESSVRANSQVSVVVELTNTSTERIWLWRARSGPPPYTVRVLDHEGKAGVLTAEGKAFQSGESVVRDDRGKIARAFPGGGEQVAVSPGESVADSISIGDLFDLGQPGEYTIQIERVNPVTNLLARSNVIILTVHK